MKEQKLSYTEPLTVVAEIENAPFFLNNSVQKVMMRVEVDEYETFDEITLDVL